MSRHKVINNLASLSLLSLIIFQFVPFFVIGLIDRKAYRNKRFDSAEKKCRPLNRFSMTSYERKSEEKCARALSSPGFTRCCWRPEQSTASISCAVWVSLKTVFLPKPLSTNTTNEKISQMTSLNTKSDSVSWTAEIKNSRTFQRGKLPLSSCFSLVTIEFTRNILPGNLITIISTLTRKPRKNYRSYFFFFWFQRKTIFEASNFIPRFLRKSQSSRRCL